MEKSTDKIQRLIIEDKNVIKYIQVVYHDDKYQRGVLGSNALGIILNSLNHFLETDGGVKIKTGAEQEHTVMLIKLFETLLKSQLQNETS